MTAAHIGERARWQVEDGRGALARLKKFKELLALWRRRSYERQVLAGLSDPLLRDIGITRCDAMNEASKPFWRA